MTTILNLPEEVFRVILEQLDSDDLLECQKVCHSWYLPVHKMFLKTIDLKDVYQVVQFINSIDSNPDPIYLSSVKRMKISEDSEVFPSQFRLNKGDIKKLFFRFPNLQTVEENGNNDLEMYSEFDDELCRELLVSCPKLHTFKVANEFVKYDNLLKLRCILTEMDLSEIHEKAVYDNASFVLGFQRLKSLIINSENICTFEKFLPIFEQLPDLTRLVVVDVRHDQNKFTERYLATKQKEKQDLLVERLSKVTLLRWHDWHGICRNALDFIAKYLTGLEKLVLYVKFTDTFTARQQYRLLCSDMLELLYSINDCYININLRISDLPTYLPFVLHKVYQQQARTDENKTMAIIVKRYYGYEDSSLAEIAIKQEPNKSIKSVSLKMVGKHSLDNLITSVLPETAPLDNVTYLKFSPFEGQDIDYTVYEHLLGWMKSLKRVFLEIPRSFREAEFMHYTFDQEYDGSIYPQVEQLTLKSYSDVKYQTLLSRFSFAFPNIRQLNIDSHCGYWRQHLGEFELVLCKYSLKYLKVDVTPMKNMMEKYINKDCATDTDFFVMELESFSTSKRHSYKVAPRSLTITRLNGDDLNGLIQGRDFFRLRIIINHLEHLELYKGSPFLYNDYDASYPKRIIKLDE